jgi:DNA-3-methyladenine glycosylase I
VSRCAWAASSPAMSEYHDREWGVPSHDERHLFEMLILEGAQAGLSWSTILAKRDRYRQVYEGFAPEVVARFGAERQAALLADPGIVRNRLKVAASVTNAAAFLEVQDRYGSFDRYLWDRVGGAPVVNTPHRADQVPPRSPLSDQLARDLKRLGFRFVGSTIVYAFLQAVGVVDDHLVGCPAKAGAPPGT